MKGSFQSLYSSIYDPIEHLWTILKDKLSSFSPKNVKELEEAVYHAWGKISADVTKRLVGNMPKRVAAVIIAKGDHTRY